MEIIYQKFYFEVYDILNQMKFGSGEVTVSISRRNYEEIATVLFNKIKSLLDYEYLLRIKKENLNLQYFFVFFELVFNKNNYYFNIFFDINEDEKQEEKYKILGWEFKGKELKYTSSLDELNYILSEIFLENLKEKRE